MILRPISVTIIISFMMIIYLVSVSAKLGGYESPLKHQPRTQKIQTIEDLQHLRQLQSATKAPKSSKTKSLKSVKTKSSKSAKTKSSKKSENSFPEIEKPEEANYSSRAIDEPKSNVDKKTFNPSQSPTMTPSAAPSFTFVLEECHTYEFYWKRDMYETCGDNWENCQCAGAQRRIDAGDINCETARCPIGCEVCIYCLMEVIDCANGYYNPNAANS